MKECHISIVMLSPCNVKSLQKKNVTKFLLFEFVIHWRREDFRNLFISFILGRRVTEWKITECLGEIHGDVKKTKSLRFRIRLTCTRSCL